MLPILPDLITTQRAEVYEWPDISLTGGNLYRTSQHSRICVQILQKRDGLESMTVEAMFTGIHSPSDRQLTRDDIY